MRRSGRSSSTRTTGGGATGGLKAIEGRPRRGAPDDRDARAAARSRKRFARRQWRRRWLAWKPLLVLVLSLALGIGAVWVLWFSAVLAVEQVRVTGTDTLSPAQVQAVAGVDLGSPLVRVDLSRIEARIGALASVRSVEVSRRWPHRLLIVVEERRPIAVVTIGDRLRALDRDGVVFGGYDAPPPGLPRVQVVEGARPEALGEAASVVSTLPSVISRRVDFVEVRTVDEISLVLKDGRRVEWGSATDSAAKARVLAVLLERKASIYDVSVPAQPTTR